jgi:hypothetical protein
VTNGTDSVSLVCVITSPNQQWELNVTENGPMSSDGNSGNLVFTGNGLPDSPPYYCDEGCQANYTTGTTVTVTAAPTGDSAGNESVFEGWQGCDSTSGPDSNGFPTECTMTMNASRTITGLVDANPGS